MGLRDLVASSFPKVRSKKKKTTHASKELHAPIQETSNASHLSQPHYGSSEIDKYGFGENTEENQTSSSLAWDNIDTINSFHGAEWTGNALYRHRDYRVNNDQRPQDTSRLMYSSDIYHRDESFDHLTQNSSIVTSHSFDGFSGPSLLVNRSINDSFSVYGPSSESVSSIYATTQSQSETYSCHHHIHNHHAHHFVPANIPFKEVDGNTKENSLKKHDGFFKKSFASFRSMRKRSQKEKIIAQKNGKGKCSVCPYPETPYDGVHDKSLTKNSKPKIKGIKSFKKWRQKENDEEKQWYSDHDTRSLNCARQRHADERLLIQPFVAPRHRFRECSVESCSSRLNSSRDQSMSRDIDLAGFDSASLSGYESDLPKGRVHRSRSRIKTNPWLPSPQPSYVGRVGTEIALRESLEDMIADDNSRMSRSFSFDNTKSPDTKRTANIQRHRSLTPCDLKMRLPQKSLSDSTDSPNIISKEATNHLNNTNSKKTTKSRPGSVVSPNSEFVLLADNIEQLAQNISFEYENSLDTTLEENESDKVSDKDLFADCESISTCSGVKSCKENNLIDSPGDELSSTSGFTGSRSSDVESMPAYSPDSGFGGIATTGDDVIINGNLLTSKPNKPLARKLDFNDISNTEEHIVNPTKFTDSVSNEGSKNTNMSSFSVLPESMIVSQSSTTELELNSSQNLELMSANEITQRNKAIRPCDLNTKVSNKNNLKTIPRKNVQKPERSLSGEFKCSSYNEFGVSPCENWSLESDFAPIDSSTLTKKQANVVNRDLSSNAKTDDKSDLNNKQEIINEPLTSLTDACIQTDEDPELIELEKEYLEELDATSQSIFLNGEKASPDMSESLRMWLMTGSMQDSADTGYCSLTRNSQVLTDDDGVTFSEDIKESLENQSELYLNKKAKRAQKVISAVERLQELEPKLDNDEFDEIQFKSLPRNWCSSLDANTKSSKRRTGNRSVVDQMFVNIENQFEEIFNQMWGPEFMNIKSRCKLKENRMSSGTSSTDSTLKSDNEMSDEDDYRVSLTNLNTGPSIDFTNRTQTNPTENLHKGHLFPINQSQSSVDDFADHDYVNIPKRKCFNKNKNVHNFSKPAVLPKPKCNQKIPGYPSSSVTKPTKPARKTLPSDSCLPFVSNFDRATKNLEEIHSLSPKNFEEKADYLEFLRDAPLERSGLKRSLFLVPGIGPVDIANTEQATYTQDFEKGPILKNRNYSGGLPISYFKNNNPEQISKTKWRGNSSNTLSALNTTKRANDATQNTIQTDLNKNSNTCSNNTHVSGFKNISSSRFQNKTLENATKKQTVSELTQLIKQEKRKIRQFQTFHPCDVTTDHVTALRKQKERVFQKLHEVKRKEQNKFNSSF